MIETTKLKGMKKARFLMNKKHPPLTFDELAQMLEIDLMLGRSDIFKKHLAIALRSYKGSRSPK